MSLLDRAFYELDLYDWVFVQHADMFWRGVNWGVDLLSSISKRPNNVAWVVPHKNCVNEFNCVEYKFALNSTKLLRTHDFAGAYNRKWFVEGRHSFNWGELKTKLPLSPKLEQVINNKSLLWTNRGHEVRFGEFVDGSDLIGLEIGVNCPHLIDVLKTSAQYIHCWDLFAISHDFQQQGDTIVVDRLEEKCARSLHTYSWISSNLLPVEGHKIFPWKVLQQMKSTNVPARKSPLCYFLERYKNTNECLGEDRTMGVERVQFRNKNYWLS